MLLSQGKGSCYCNKAKLKRKQNVIFPSLSFLTEVADNERYLSYSKNVVSFPSSFSFPLDFNRISGYFSSKSSATREVPLESLSVARDVFFFLQVDDGTTWKQGHQLARRQCPCKNKIVRKSWCNSFTSDEKWWANSSLSAEHHLAVRGGPASEAGACRQCTCCQILPHTERKVITRKERRRRWEDDISEFPVPAKQWHMFFTNSVLGQTLPSAVETWEAKLTPAALAPRRRGPR